MGKNKLIAQSILKDYRVLGESLWQRFQGGREGTLWYYRTLVDTLKNNGPNAMVEELERIVLEIEALGNSKK